MDKTLHTITYQHQESKTFYGERKTKVLCLVLLMDSVLLPLDDFNLNPFVVINCNCELNSFQWLLWVLLENHQRWRWYWEISELAGGARKEDGLGCSTLKLANSLSSPKTASVFYMLIQFKIQLLSCTIYEYISNAHGGYSTGYTFRLSSLWSCYAQHTCFLTSSRSIVFKISPIYDHSTWSHLPPFEPKPNNPHIIYFIASGLNFFANCLSNYCTWF